jgi:putative two-component system response regulator
LDGTGYPDGLAGDHVPFPAQIVKVIDMFDALTTNRPYRVALSPAKTFEVLRDDAQSGGCAGRLVETFIELYASGRFAGRPDAHSS